MMMFMEEKMQKLIHAAKLKHNNYKADNAGDEYRLYSEHNSSIFEKDRFSEMLPTTEHKMMKVVYPSKLELYTKMRIEEEKKEDEYMN